MRTVSIYLVRHGLAAERGAAWPDDAKRPLVARGVEQLRKETAALKAMAITFDTILTSPLTRGSRTSGRRKESLLATSVLLKGW